MRSWSRGTSHEGGGSDERRVRRDRDRWRSGGRERRPGGAPTAASASRSSRRELVGGECSYWGCIPSKTLIRPGDVLAAARRVPGRGRGGHRRDRRRRRVRAARRHDERLERRRPGAVVRERGHRLSTRRGPARGRARGRRRAADGAVTPLDATKAVVIATGTVRRRCRRSTDWPTSRRGTTATSRPRRSCPSGCSCSAAGTIGCEMAQAFKRLGTRRGHRRRGRPRLARPRGAVRRRRGVRGVRGRGDRRGARRRDAATGVRADDGPVVLTLDDGRTFEGDELLVAVGRRPTTADLGLDVVGLTPGKSLEVDDRLRAVGVPGDWLYAVGDCNGRRPAHAHGQVPGPARRRRHPRQGRRRRRRPRRCPRVTFTDPQVARSGSPRREAREKGVNVKVVKVGTGDVAGAYTSRKRR